MAYSLKITVFNNRDYEQSFTLQDEDGPLDLNGNKLIFSVSTDEEKYVSHTTGTPANKCIYITDAADGQITLKLPYSVLKNIPVGNHPHELIIVDPLGKRSGIWTGMMTVKKGVSN